MCTDGAFQGAVMRAGVTPVRLGASGLRHNCGTSDRVHSSQPASTWLPEDCESPSTLLDGDPRMQVVPTGLVLGTAARKRNLGGVSVYADAPKGHSLRSRAFA